jgi:hypothetical protein
MNEPFGIITMPSFSSGAIAEVQETSDNIIKPITGIKKKCFIILFIL